MITIYLTPFDGEGVLNNGGIIKTAKVDENDFSPPNPARNFRYHGGYGGEGTWWHTTLTKAKKCVAKRKAKKIDLLRKQIKKIQRLRLKVS